MVNILINFTAAYADLDVFTQYSVLISGVLLCLYSLSRKKIKYCAVLLYCFLWYASYMCKDLYILFITIWPGATTHYCNAYIANSMGILLRLMAIWQFIKCKKFKWRKKLKVPRGIVAVTEWYVVCVSQM